LIDLTKDYLKPKDCIDFWTPIFCDNKKECEEVRDQILKNKELVEFMQKELGGVKDTSEILQWKDDAEHLKKLPLGLILQHVRDSFSADEQFMSDNAKIQTRNLIIELKDLMEAQD